MQKIKQRDYERASQLLGDLFDVEADIVSQIKNGIRHNGLSEFFKNLDAYDFPQEVSEKLSAVRQVLFGTRTEEMPKYFMDSPDTINNDLKGGDQRWGKAMVRYTHQALLKGWLHWLVFPKEK